MSASMILEKETVQAAVTDLLLREAEYLDAREWEEWLELFTADTVFWVPAWKSEDQPTDDPESEVSLIYYEGRERLEERVWRLRSGLSAASVPLTRTVHCVGNIRVESVGADRALAHTAWTVHQYNSKRKTQHVYFGRSAYQLHCFGGDWRIAVKKITLANDFIHSILDFYSL